MPIWTLYGIKRGIVTTSWPDKEDAEVQLGVLGLPRFQPDRCQEKCRACAEVCLPGAIEIKGGTIGRTAHR